MVFNDRKTAAARNAARPASTCSWSTATPGRATICATPPTSASSKARRSRSCAATASHALSRQRAGGRPRECRLPGIETVLAPDLVGEVDDALNRIGNRSIGAAPQRLMPRRIAARAEDLKLTDETGFVDRLLMGKLDVRDRCDPPRGEARRRRLRGVPAGRPRRPRRLRADRGDRGVLPRQWRRRQLPDHRRRRRRRCAAWRRRAARNSSAATW